MSARGVLWAGLLAGGLLAAPCWAQDAADKRIIQVDVSGAKTIAKETILARAQTKPGSAYLDRVVSEDIRRIFALGYFTNVKADIEEVAEGLKLVFTVAEKPAVSAIDVQGHRALAKKKLLEVFGIRPGDLYDPRKIKEGVDQVKAEYARKGFSNVEIATRTEPHEADNTATLYVLVDEGPQLRIRDVFIEGNQAFADRKIRGLLKTKPKRWFRSGAYAEPVLAEDLERIKAFYRKHGYADIEAAHEVARDPSGRGLIVRFMLTEGLQHRVGSAVVDGAVLFPEREIRQVIRLKPGAVFNDEALQEDLRAIKQYYGDRGYIHAMVTPDPQLDEATKRVNVTYRIAEQELVSINRIEVQGNLQTKDVVVRRELRVYPGEPFQGAKIRKSIERLYNLGFFEEVNVDTEPTATAEKEDLIVKVKESKTGSFSFGGGFSSVDRLIGMVEVEQRNFDWRNIPQFTGAGQDLRARVEIGSVRRFFDISFTEPWIFGYPVSAGVDLYNRTFLKNRNLGWAFEQEQRGGGLRFGKEFLDLVRVNVDYQLFRTAISDVDESASSALKAEQGKSTVSVLGLSVTMDGRDNKFDPTKGYVLFGSTNLAGGFIGGQRDFYRLQGGASYYWPHFNRFVLESRAKAGMVEAYGDSDEVPIFERFFGGGSGTIRGFRERRVGPRDPISNDPTGGEAMFVGTVEEVMTLAKDERGRPILRGSVFYDVGDVWRRVSDFGESLKSGIGIGARVNTPIGPLRLDLGYPVTRQDDQEKRRPRFHFNISRSF
ncbi:MAG: outer membrane protein assembly factor BamA [Candidatus Omnitrophica bacterium]|nr:outer membrane protein assembly factor BamA [Candidatus Omnitrophota bacterium]